MESRNHVQTIVLALMCLMIASFTRVDADQRAQANSTTAVQRSTYIIRVRPPVGFSDDTHHADLERWYKSFLALEPTPSNTGNGPSLVHAYRAAMTGFAARLTKDEASVIAGKDDVLGVYQSRILHPHTTHTPDFLGLRAVPGGNGRGVWDDGHMGEGVIVAVLDEMLDPEHVSFHDDGMRPPPAKWHGKCDLSYDGKPWPCNKKIIGGSGATSGSEIHGHSTHTASTAAGNFVISANVLGSGNGTAAGMAPRAHLAIYDACKFGTECLEAHVVAAMDQAISDGVDVISLSLGLESSRPFFDDPIAIGAFNAMQKGILVTCAAGNSGPRPGSLSNDLAWILTVGASTIDRQMQAIVKLGDGQTFIGETAYQTADLPPTPLAPRAERDPYTGADCHIHMPGVTGRIAVCEHGYYGWVANGADVKHGGAVGMLVLGREENGGTPLAEPHVLPTSYVPYPASAAIKKYMNSSKDPVAEIAFRGTSIGGSAAPVVASFSSRGPSMFSPGILKPDVIGPGVNIIAAWASKVGPGGDDDYWDQNDAVSNTSFTIESGTSIAASHLSGVVALIKSEHPNWSPAMIKSAIMTTAYTVRPDGKPILDDKLNAAGFFATGAGHVNPSKAIDPGLVYDIKEAEYVAYICGLGYSETQVEIITHKKNACRNTIMISGAELNYPSIVARATAGKITVNRTLTSVVDVQGKYTVDVSLPDEIVAEVLPSVLEFDRLSDKRSFTVRLNWDPAKTKHAEGTIQWVSKTHVVRTPVVIF